LSTSTSSATAAEPALSSNEPGQHDPAATAPLLCGLTPEQAQAVTHGAGPQVIYAGPGAGKTRTLIKRVEYLLATGTATARQIVVVTFTNNAARECAARLEKSLGAATVNQLLICTFHALCARILRQHAQRFGRTPSFTIYDQRAVLGLVEYVLGDKLRVAVQAKLEQRPGTTAETIRDEISLAKNRLWTPDFHAQHARHEHASLIAAVWREVDQELADSNAVDFDDLLSCAVRLIGEHPDLQAHYRARWPWLLVDEVQDTCYAQMGLLRLLTQPGGNLTIVGDRDQALYAWRGAEPRNLLAFARLFPQHRAVTLGRNFRSREEIVHAAESVIINNCDRPTIEFESARGPGGHVQVRSFDNEYAEAGWIANEIARQIDAGLPPEQILVVARAGFATNPVKRALDKAGITHQVLGLPGLFERSHVKDVLAYIALLVNPQDKIALRRAIGAPTRGVGDVTTAAIVAHARAQNITLLEACARAPQLSLARVRARAKDNLAVFGQQMLGINAAREAGATITQTVSAALTLGGGLVEHYQRLRDTPSNDQSTRDQAAAALSHLQQIRDSARLYERQTPATATLLGFFERAVGLHSDGPAITEEGVRISTIHRAKGTEAALVFMVACEEDILPSRHALASGSLLALEEERSACYVGMTRAEDVLVLTWAQARQGRATRGRSRFLDEAGL
jgi:DNA helicase-2/ATP-dependent DNA helicase PcrA